MPSVTQNSQVLRASTGFLVQRTTQTVLQALTTMFTVTGGDILLRALWGELTTANDGTATTISVGHTSSLGSVGSKPAALATAVAITSKEIGTKIGLGATVAAALTVSADATVPLLRSPDLIIGPGVITYTGAIGLGTALVQWNLVYAPLAPGASVVSNFP